MTDWASDPLLINAERMTNFLISSLSHYKTSKIVSTMRICRIVSHNKKIEFGSSSQGLIELRFSNVSRQDNRNFIKLRKIRKVHSPRSSHCNSNCRIQRKRVSSIAPLHLQRFQMFNEYWCTHRLRANVCRVALTLTFLNAYLTRVNTFLQPKHRTMQMSNSSCTTSFP